MHWIPCSRTKRRALVRSSKTDKLGGIVEVDRSVIQLFDLIVELFPFIVLQSAALDLLARYLTDVYDQTVHQLKIAHFQREDRHRYIEIDGHILGH